jgi:hypothetical protein
MLDTVLRAFIRGITDEEVRHSALRLMVSPDRSLLGVYNAAEEARRAKFELQKFREKERRLKDLEFYRGLVQRNMSSHQIEALRTAFYTGASSGTHWNTPACGGPPAQAEELDTPQPNIPSATRDKAYAAGPRPNQSQNRGQIRQAPNQAPGPGPDPRTSSNPYINGSRQYRPGGPPLCFGCGSSGHISLNCTSTDKLEEWEKRFIKDLVLHNRRNATISASLVTYDCESAGSSASSVLGSIPMTPSTSSGSDLPPTASASSRPLTWGLSQLSIRPAGVEAEIEILANEAVGAHPSKGP